MSNYYNEKRKANIDLRNIINKSKADKTELNINSIIIHLTEKYAVSDKSIKDRLNLLSETYEYTIIDGVIKWL